MPLATAKELKKFEDQNFYTALNSSISEIDAQFQKAKHQDLTFILSKEGKFDVWLEHSQLKDNVTHHLQELIQAIKDKKRKSKLLKIYEQIFIEYKQYMSNWTQVDDIMKSAQLSTMPELDSSRTASSTSLSHRGSTSSHPMTLSSTSSRSSGTLASDKKRWI